MHLWKFFTVSLVASVATSVCAATAVSGKDYDRIVIIVLENQDYKDCIADPYFSKVAENHNGTYGYQKAFFFVFVCHSGTVNIYIYIYK